MTQSTCLSAALDRHCHTDADDSFMDSRYQHW